MHITRSDSSVTDVVGTNPAKSERRDLTRAREEVLGFFPWTFSMLQLQMRAAPVSKLCAVTMPARCSHWRACSASVSNQARVLPSRKL